MDRNATRKMITLWTTALVIGLGAAAALAAEQNTQDEAGAPPRFLDAKHAPRGEGWITLFNGKDLAGWHRRPSHHDPLSWKVVDGVMKNDLAPGQHGTDLVSDPEFDDLELYYEYRVPPGSNSGMYLHGRYEIQILDDYGKEPAKGGNGGIWATAAPTRNVSRKPGEWQSVYTKFVDRTFKTVVLNGVQVHQNVKPTGPTGSQLDNKVDEPGPLMIQGNHGAVEVRVVMARPLGKYIDAGNAPIGKGWIPLCNGKDLTGWHPRPQHRDRPVSWTVTDGVMINTTGHGKHGCDIVTDRKFDDFEIYYEYRIPRGSNSGLYLRGRYEIQILDDAGKPPSKGGNGGLYNTAAPAQNVSRPAGEWQSVRAKIAGNVITIVLNGTKVVDGVKVERPTGGQLDREMGTPGPIMIQGDHGSIEVRRLMIKPLGS